MLCPDLDLETMSLRRSSPPALSPPSHALQPCLIITLSTTTTCMQFSDLVSTSSGREISQGPAGSGKVLSSSERARRESNRTSRCRGAPHHVLHDVSQQFVASTRSKPEESPARRSTLPRLSTVQRAQASPAPPHQATHRAQCSPLLCIHITASPTRQSRSAQGVRRARFHRRLGLS